MKRVMRKISDCILIAVLCLTLFLTAVTPVAFAVAGTTLADVCKAVGSEADVQSDDFMNLINAYVDFYSDLGQGDFLGALVDGTVDIPLSWLSLTTGAFEDVASGFTIPKDTLIMHPAGYNDLLYFINEAGEFVLYDNRSGGGGRVRDVEETDYACIDGDTFARLAQMYNDHYGPKNTTEYISWRTDTRWADYASYNLSFFTEGYFCGNTSWQEVYLVPFVNYGGENWFSIYRYHFYYETTKDDDGNNVITLYVDTYNMFDETMLSERVAVSSLLTDYRYMDIGLHEGDSPRLLCGFYSSYTNYITRNVNSSCYPNTGVNVNNYGNLYYSSVSQDPIRVSGQSDSDLLYFHFSQNTVTAHDEACEDTEHDFGYYCYNEPIVMDYSGVDWSQFSEDDIITLSGDTLYDCVITNNNGDTSTVNEYITNNYTYVTNNYGDSDSSGEEGSGSASGDVDVDVNVNVDVDTGSDGDSMPVDVNLENYLEQTPEQAKPITDFFAIFFDFLPAELLGLICLGVVVAIILRVWGR